MYVVRLLSLLWVTSCLWLASCSKEKVTIEPIVVSESAEQREDSINAAFKSDKEPNESLSDDKLHSIAVKFFKRFGRAAKSKRSGAFNEVFSTEDLIAKLERAGAFEGKDADFIKGFKSGLKKGFAKGLSQLAYFLSFDDLDVMRCESLSANEFVAYTSSWSDDFEVYSKMRWWLIKDGAGNWRVYDYEDFDMNIRATDLSVTLIKAASGKSEAWMVEFTKLVKFLHGANSENLLDRLQSMEAVSAKLLQHHLPDKIYIFAHIMHASSLVSLEKNEEALKSINLAAEKAPSLPTVFYMRSTIYQALERWDEAIEQLDKYIEALGSDSDIYEQLADCYIGKEDYGTAEKYAKMGVEDNPNALGCLESYCVSIDEDEVAKVMKIIEQSRRAEEAFEVCVETFSIMESTEVARSLFEKMKQRFPKNPRLKALKITIEATENHSGDLDDE